MQLTLDRAHDQVIAALRGIKNGKGLTDSVAVPPYGSRVRIAEALETARRLLKEPFHAEHIELVDATFGRTWLFLRPSDRIDDCATALLETLSHRRTLRGPSEANARFPISGFYSRTRDGKNFKWFGLYTSEFPTTWEARVFLADDKPHDVLKDEPREVLSGPLVDQDMNPALLRALAQNAIERSVEECETI